MLALLLAILSSPILGAPLATADTPVTMVVTGGTLIDGTGRDPLADSAIPIRDGRVDAVTTGSMSSIPADARRIDARGKWIIPGLIDMHVH